MNLDKYQDIFNRLKVRLAETVFLPKFFKKPAGSLYPMVVFEEIQNASNTSTVDRREQTSLLGFEINIYAKDATFGGRSYANNEIARELQGAIDEIMSDFYGLQRTSARATPNIDTSIYRITMQYTSVLNETRNKFM